MAIGQNLPRLPRGRKLALLILINQPALPGTLVWDGSTSIQKRRLRLINFHGMTVWEPMVTAVDEVHLLFPALPVAVPAAFHPWRETTVWVRHCHKMLLVVVLIIMALLLRLNHTNRGTTCRAATIVTCDMRHKDDMKVGVSIHLSLHRHLVLCNPCDLKTRREGVGDHRHLQETIV